MRPTLIDGNKLSREASSRVWTEFLIPNGVRHYVPENAQIKVHGNYMDVPTWNIERPSQRRSTRGHYRPWRTAWPGPKDEVPIKTRTYRVRVPLPEGIL